jgi:hypothetical protein
MYDVIAHEFYAWKGKAAKGAHGLQPPTSMHTSMQRKECQCQKVAAKLYSKDN